MTSHAKGSHAGARRGSRGVYANGRGRIRKRRAEALRAARRRNVLVEEHEQRLFRFISEQNAVRIGQLCRAFGVYRADMERFVTQFEKRLLVESGRFVTGDDVWVWLTLDGTRLAGTGYPQRTPHHRNLAHWGAVTDARITLEQRNSEIVWICERALRGERTGQQVGYIPDAIATHRVSAGNGEVRELRYAIEVELSPKPAAELEDRISTNERYSDLIIYFAAPRVNRKIAALGLRDRHPRLRVVEIPEVERYLDQPAWRLPGDPGPMRGGQKFDYDSIELTDLELDIVDLVIEQGLMPVDQVGAFFDLETEECEYVIGRLVKARVLTRAKPLVHEPPWVWVSRIGVKFSRTGLRGMRPSISGLERTRAVNQVRLLLAKGRPDVRWTSARALARSRTGRGRPPAGAIELSGELHAVDVVSSAPRDLRLEERFARRLEEGYDAEMWFYSKQSGWAVKGFRDGLSEKYRKRLVLRPLPQSEFLPMAPEAVEAKPVRSERTVFDRLAEGLPVRLRRMPVDLVRPGAVDAVARAAGVDRVPIVKEAWVDLTAIGVRWLVTDAGFFRVVQLGAWARAERVPREDIFIKEEGDPISPETEKRARRMRALDRPQMEDRVWAAVEKEIPPGLRSESIVAVRGVPPVDDRALLSGALWFLRNDIPLAKVPGELGYGSGRAINDRVRYWESISVWEKMKEILRRELPDGAQLEWGRLDPKKGERTGAQRSESEMDDRVWALVEAILERVSIPRRPGMDSWVSDRVVLSAAIWRLRNFASWDDVNKSGYCSAPIASARIRAWESAGIWKGIRAVLEAELPDGSALAWGRLERRIVRPRFDSSDRQEAHSAQASSIDEGASKPGLPFNQRQRALLARMRANSRVKFSLVEYVGLIGVAPEVARDDLTALVESGLLIKGPKGESGEPIFGAAPDLSGRLDRIWKR